MENVKKILVGLDLTLIDQTLLRCVKLLEEVYRPEKFIFVHVVPANAIGESADPEMKLLSRVQMSVLEEELHEEIKEFGLPDLAYKLIIKTGSPFAEIIESSISENADLMVMGKKKDLKGSGIVPLELTRFSPTSILFVPEKHKCRLRNITVCNDFSRFSAEAMNSAINLTKQDPENLSITSLHIFSGGNETDLDLEQHRQQELVEQYNKFIEHFNLENIHITPKFLSSGDATITRTIGKHVNARKTDLVITGSRGRSVRSTFLIGSLTEKLVRSTMTVPLLVIKPHLRDSALEEELLRELQNS